MTKAKRLPLPKRFSVALTQKAYENLRGLNAKYGYGNNYLLTFILENLGEVTDPEALESMFQRCIAEYGAPAPGSMIASTKKDI